jgi:hypothetical protein
VPRRRGWPRHRNVYRYEHHHFTGWAVSIKPRGERFTRYFADRKDSAAALARAVAWRDKRIASLPPPAKLKRRYVLNTTGVIGVFRSVERSRSGAILPRYGATWRDGRRQFKRSFSPSTVRGRREHSP